MTPKRAYVLFAESKSHRDSWMSFLMQHVEKIKKISQEVSPEGRESAPLPSPRANKPRGTAIILQKRPSELIASSESNHDSSDFSDDLDNDLQRLRDMMTVGFSWLPGEKFSKKFSEIYCVAKKVGKIAGNLLLTNYRLIFKPEAPESPVLEVPVTCIRKIVFTTSGNNATKKILKKKLNEVDGIVVKTADFRKLVFEMSKKDKEDLSRATEIYCPASLNSLFAFFYGRECRDYKDFEDGWKLYDPRAEYQRLGIPCDKWRISEANVGYEIADTYPSLLVVPSCISDQELAHSALFRTKGRCPVVNRPHSKFRNSIS